MKITKIELKHFRGFPGPAVNAFELGGKNLLLYGENRSGKSSLYHALNQLFNIERDAPAFDDLINLFGKDELGNDVADGYVKVYLDDRPSYCLTWAQNNTRPEDPILIDAAMRKGFLEYRSLLQTNLVEGSLSERLFRQAVTVLLARIPVILGGIPRTLGEFWKDVHKPRSHRQRDLQVAESAINRFNQAFKAILPEVEQKAAEMLDYFTGHHLKFRLEFEDLIYDKTKRAIQNQALHLRVEFNDRPIQRHEIFLNEARLSALALALCLASVLLSNPTSGPAVTSPLKLLVLDDVLIGLDLSNRLPLLEILDAYFADYQIILSTYDRVWFELARERTEISGRWVYLELFAGRHEESSYDIPILRTGRNLLERAREHFLQNDYRAAAVYARAAFESMLKKYCEDKRILVPFKRDVRRVTSEQLWKAVCGDHTDDGPCHVDDKTKAKIKALRKVVLNPLSHDGASSVTKAEVEATIEAIEKLDLRKIDECKKSSEADRRSMSGT